MQQSIRCSSCGQPNALGQRFCWNCGTTLATGCTNCGAPLDPGSRFCGNCGAQMPSSGGQPPPQQPGGWGQPPPQQPGGWGQPPPQQPGGWGQPPPQQPGGWGQPPPQQPGGWGQPPPQQPGGWGQPPGGMPQAGAWVPPRRAKSGSGGLVVLLVVLLIFLGAFSYLHFSGTAPWAQNPSGTTPGTTTTTSAITTGPFVFAVSTNNTTSTAKMEIKWETTGLYKGQLEYGTDEKYGTTSQLESNFVKAHVASLPDLKLSTSYNYRIILKNQDNKEWKSSNYTFKTPKGS